MQAEQKPRFRDLLEERVTELEQIIAATDELAPRDEQDYAWLDDVVERALDAIRVSPEAS